jgi:hypothetical protein
VYSGAGVGGKTWTGSALSFTVKDIVPTVQYITNGLTPRDSTRIYGPATGGTVITVIGANFQNSPQLRCFFAQNKILSQAQWISDTMVTCKTPPFFSFLNDDGTTKANYDGSAMNPHTKVHVTNDGMINDDIEGSRLSQNPHMQDDNSYSYIHGVPAQRWKETWSGRTLLNSVKTTLTDIDPVTPGTGNTAYTAAPSGTACTGAGELTTTATYTTAADAMVACNNMVHCHGISQNGGTGNFKLCNAASTWAANTAMTCAYVAAANGKKCTGAGQYGTATFTSRALAEAACNIDPACHGVSQNGVSASASYTLCNDPATWVTDATMTCSTTTGTPAVTTVVDHKCIHQRTQTTTSYSGGSLAGKCVWQRAVPTSSQAWNEPLDTYVDGYNPHNPFRSTCIEGKFQNFQEKMGPCYNAGLPGNSEGNDVLFKYATCYESQKAGEYKDGITPEPSFDLYGNGATDASTTLVSNFFVVQRFKIDKSKNLEGPLSHVQIHLEKPTSEVAELEVNITANGLGTPVANANAISGGTVLASVKIHVHRIANSFAASPHADSLNRYFNVFFPTAPYLMPDRAYDFTIRHISGAQDVRFNYTNGASTGNTVYQNSTSPAAVNYNIRGFTCDGCRERMTFNPNLATPYSSIKFGEIPTSIRTDETNNANAGTGVGNAAITGSWFSNVLQPAASVSSGYSANTQIHAYDQPSGGYRTMVAQAFRPKETGTLTHVKLRLKTSKIYHGNVNEYKAKISVWVTEHGKYGEYVCNEFGGNQVGNMCDGSAITNDLTQSPSGFTGSSTGTFNQPCGLGTVCNPYNGLNGGCGDRGVCSLATTVTNAHRLRPESGDPAQGPCSYDSKCSDTMSLNPDHEKILGQVDNLASTSWTVFEFKVPVPVTKHTTYYFNAAVVGDAMESGEVIWYAAKGDSQNVPVAAPFNPYGISNTAAPDELYNGGNYGAFKRDATTWNWALASETTAPANTRVAMAISFIRCVTAHSNVMGFTTTGEKTGCCSARASTQGGDKGATVTVTGRNFFPSDHLRCVFRNEDGTAGVQTQATVTNGDYTTATCPAPTHSPHTSRDCSNPALCKGVELVMTHDGHNIGPQYMGPKWHNACPSTLGSTCTQTLATTALPAYSGQNPLKFLFSEIYVAVTGSDTTGDGTLARPYGTIQRGLDAANENDQLLLLTGTYVGLGNRGLRHHGKKIQLKAYSGEHTVTIDCQHAPDGFILNNNKDSDSPFAGYVDTQGIITRNCDNLRIYDI